MAKINRDLIEPIMIAIFAGILGSTIGQNLGSFTATIKPFAERFTYTINQLGVDYGKYISAIFLLFMTAYTILAFRACYHDPMHRIDVLYKVIRYRKMLKFRKKLRKNLQKNIDSILITSIYVILLSITGGIIVYLSTQRYNLDIYISILLFMLFLLLESVLMLYKVFIIKTIPTPGIILSLLPVLIYKASRLRDRKMISIKGIKILIYYIRYILLNPAWSREDNNKSDPFNGLRDIKWIEDIGSWAEKPYALDRTVKCYNLFYSNASLQIADRTLCDYLSNSER